MGFSVQSIEYMNNTWAQGEGSRALGNTGDANYWTRITILTDAAGSTGASITLDIEAYNGVTYQEYANGAQAIISTSPSPSSYVGTTPNLAAQRPTASQARWIFSGAVAANMAANMTYYIVIVPCWSEPDRFARYTQSLSAISTADWPSYALSISQGTGSSVAVYRSASPLGAAIGYLGNGSAIYYGDTLSFSYSAGAAYTVSAHTINGVTRYSGYSFTVTGGVSAVVTASVKSFTLTLSPGQGTTISAARTSSPYAGAASGALASGATIYYGDVLEITAAAQSGYVFGSATLNGQPLVSPHTVSANVTVVATATQAGAWLYVGNSFASYQIMIFSGSTWDTYIPYVYTGAGWEVY